MTQPAYFTSFTLIILCLLQIACTGHCDCKEHPREGKKLFVFIGEKIEVKEQEGVYFGWLPYGSFKAKYRILKSICGEFYKDTIEFTAYDHYGLPAFANFKNVMLFLNNDNDTFTHVMYQYYDVYQTKKGDWAAPYNTRYYSNEEDSSVKPGLIEFKKEVFYDVKGKPKKEIRKKYPSPYFRISEDWSKATAVWGNNTNELFEIAKKTFLTSWEYYGDTASQDSFKINDLVLEDIAPPLPPLKFPRKDSLTLIMAWQRFSKALSEKDTAYIRKNSLDSVFCSVCEELYNYSFDNKIEALDSFMVASSLYFQGTTLWQDIVEEKFEVFTSREYDYLDSTDKIYNSHQYPLITYSIHFKTPALIDSMEYEQRHEFSFIKNRNKFYFIGMRSHSF